MAIKQLCTWFSVILTLTLMVSPSLHARESSLSGQNANPSLFPSNSTPPTPFVSTNLRTSPVLNASWNLVSFPIAQTTTVDTFWPLIPILPFDRFGSGIINWARLGSGGCIPK